MNKPIHHGRTSRYKEVYSIEFRQPPRHHVHRRFILQRHVVMWLPSLDTKRRET